MVVVCCVSCGLLLVVCKLLLVVWLSGVRCVAACCLLFLVSCLQRFYVMPVVCWSGLIVRCLFWVVCRLLLFVACCLLISN